MPVDFLSDDQVAAYGRFVGSPSQLELERFCFLDDTDQELVGRHRGDHNRLGFSLQLVTVRALGTFLTDPLDVPPPVVDYLAEQLGIADPSCVKNYLEREKTRFEHQWEIIAAGQWRDFGLAEAELTQWVDDRAWTTGDGPKAIFDGAVGWLRERRVLLPGVTTLTRLVARVTDAALQRVVGHGGGAGERRACGGAGEAAGGCGRGAGVGSGAVAAGPDRPVGQGVGGGA